MRNKAHAMSYILEQIDPLDDESIPKYKKWKRTRNKWLHIMEWVSLVVVCTLLTCSVRIERLRNVYWLQIVLWQWVTLALVVLCGRLISGWAVKVINYAFTQLKLNTS